MSVRVKQVYTDSKRKLIDSGCDYLIPNLNMNDQKISTLYIKKKQQHNYANSLSTYPTYGPVS